MTKVQEQCTKYGVFRRFLGCGAGEDEAMTRWGEIKCPRCEELEASWRQSGSGVRRLRSVAPTLQIQTAIIC
jgi:hypothetical protein